MHHEQHPNPAAASIAYQSSGAKSGMGFNINRAQELKTSVEGWEQCLRNQITSHPRIALGTGLLAGLILGWWVKR